MKSMDHPNIIKLFETFEARSKIRLPQMQVEATSQGL